MIVFLIAISACSTVTILFILSKMIWLPDSIPYPTTIQPAFFIHFNSSKFTRLTLPWQTHFIFNFLIFSHIAIVLALLITRSSSLKKMPSIPYLSFKVFISFMTFSADLNLISLNVFEQNLQL